MNNPRQDLFTRSPWMNAAGTLGFSPPRSWRWPAEMGVFITNPVSLSTRSPATTRSALPYPGGLLLHTGLPNPGLKAVLKKHLARWEHSETPVWVHLLAESPDEMHQMLRILEEHQGVVMAVEVGIPPQASSEEALALVGAAVGELPVVAAVPLTAASESWLADLPRLGTSAISLVAPRGSQPGDKGNLTNGRLYGPGLLPLVFPTLQILQQHGLPVIAGCGVYRLEDGEALLKAGAWGVQVDTALWLP
jgi:dihydroorotate dehydrogenase (NAD+) catalytic subunit